MPPLLIRLDINASLNLFYLGGLILDTTIIVMVIKRTKKIAERAAVSNAPAIHLLQVYQRDGILYYVVTGLLQLFNILVNLLGVKYQTAVARLVLSLRKNKFRPTRGQIRTGTRPSENDDFDGLAFTSVVAAPLFVGGLQGSEDSGTMDNPAEHYSLDTVAKAPAVLDAAPFDLPAQNSQLTVAV
ncbi:hypothetical protein BU17DRAFT_71412 [Hysterangium stoloniferum]|nr:hypothetical protein BU17DRAFT_71412 [Hysterangium stoloniferum]